MRSKIMSQITRIAHKNCVLFEKHQFFAYTFFEIIATTKEC